MNSILFAGSYAAAEEPGIQALHFDETAGQATVLGAFTGVANPSFLAVHPSRLWLYAVSETGQGSVVALSYEAGPSDIQELNRQPAHGDSPCHLAIDQTGRWIVVSNYMSGNVCCYPILADGSLGDLSNFVQHAGSGPNRARQEGPHAHSATFTPDNRFVIVADLGIDRLMIYRFDAELGKLRLHEAIPTAPGAGPRHLAFHPNGHDFYVANELNSTLSRYVYNYKEDGTRFTLHQTLSTLESDNPENTVADLQISSAGDLIYLSNRGDNSIAIFTIGDGGSLSRSDLVSCGGNWPRNIELSPRDHRLLIANRRSSEISILTLALDKPLKENSIRMSEVSCLVFKQQPQRLKLDQQDS